MSVRVGHTMEMLLAPFPSANHHGVPCGRRQTVHAQAPPRREASRGKWWRRLTRTLRSRQLEQPLDGLPQYTMAGHLSLHLRARDTGWLGPDGRRCLMQVLLQFCWGRRDPGSRREPVGARKVWPAGSGQVVRSQGRVPARSDGQWLGETVVAFRAWSWCRSGRSTRVAFGPGSQSGHDSHRVGRTGSWDEFPRDLAVELRLAGGMFCWRQGPMGRQVRTSTSNLQWCKRR